MNSGPILDQLYQIGQVFWAPSLFLFGDRRRYLVKGSYNPASGDYDYQVTPMVSGEFNNPEQPIQTLDIRYPLG
jgi:hypothetical protein